MYHLVPDQDTIFQTRHDRIDEHFCLGYLAGDAEYFQLINTDINIMKL